MNNLPDLTQFDLKEAIDAQVAQLLATKMPSLRILHEAANEPFKIDFDVERAKPLALKTPQSRSVPPALRNAAGAWIDMLQSAVKPARIAKLRAKATPSKNAVEMQSAAFLASTILMVSNWPGGLPPIDRLGLEAHLSCHLWRDGGEPILDLSLALMATGGAPEDLMQIEPIINAVADDFGGYWKLCCGKIGPWLDDGGITDLKIVVPVRSSDATRKNVIFPDVVTMH